jgi:hypothetical protein
MNKPNINLRTRSPKQTRTVQRAVKRAEKIESYYNSQTQFLAKVQAGIEERERNGKTDVFYPGHHKEMRRMAQKLARKLVWLELKKRDTAIACMAAFDGYAVVPDLVRLRDMDIYHWKSIGQFRRELMQPISYPFPSLTSAFDKWERRILESYTDEHIEQQLLAFCKDRILGVRHQNGVTEYLLP